MRSRPVMLRLRDTPLGQLCLAERDDVVLQSSMRKRRTVWRFELVGGICPACLKRNNGRPRVYEKGLSQILEHIPHLIHEFHAFFDALEASHSSERQ